MPRKEDDVCGATGFRGPEDSLPLEDHGRTRPHGAQSPLEQRSRSKVAMLPQVASQTSNPHLSESTPHPSIGVYPSLLPPWSSLFTGPGHKRF